MLSWITTDLNVCMPERVRTLTGVQGLKPLTLMPSVLSTDGFCYVVQYAVVRKPIRLFFFKENTL